MEAAGVNAGVATGENAGQPAHWVDSMIGNSFT